MATPTKKTVKRKSGSARRQAELRHTVPLTASSPSLLKRGSDAQFRELINGLLTLTVRIEMLRDHLAERLGVTGPHYSLLMTVGRLGGHQGISVGKVAQALRVTSAFVATESNRLVKAGLIEKRPDELDRRSVLLFLTPAAIDRLAKLGPEIQNVNDKTFGSLSQAEFDQLTRLVGRLLGSASVALHELATPDKQDEGSLTLNS
jgi:MarR family transcriptional regulator, organic hydroperoxide resistance regulator